MVDAVRLLTTTRRIRPSNARTEREAAEERYYA